YGPPNDGPVMLGGPELTLPGMRAVPSLTYLQRQPDFSIGPDDRADDDNSPTLAQRAEVGQTANRVQKTATQSDQSADNVVPQGGLFWDGRADTLQIQATGPLVDPREMDGGSIELIAEKLRNAPYAKKFAALFGEGILKNDNLLVAEATFAVSRYQIEEPSFHPYTSKFDYWLEGKARLSESEMRGLQLFNDPEKANCGGCPLSHPCHEHPPPLLTAHHCQGPCAPPHAALGPSTA